MNHTLSKPLPTSAREEYASTARQHRLTRWLREPLLHFLLLGALLFAVDHVVNGRVDDPHTIRVDASVDEQAIQVFKAARGREPNEEELYALRKVWLDNEVLYREGLALGVDKGDPAIRERVIFKALSVVDSNVKLPPFDDNLLREWFEKHRAKYDEPARFDLQEAVLVGDRSEAAVRAFVETLRKGTAGELNAGLRVFKGRPRSNIVQSYGDEFAKALEQSSSREWVALPTRDGWRAVQLVSITQPRPANFEALRNVVMQDWTDATMAEQRTAAVRALARKYIVKLEPVAK
ncbi:peptidyl-prolyl cis-trans isomerase [Dechloromonas denitrificans]|uniref:peptidylprolyl isomerase n=1 Tax=Dechloromonas denitrificans TaxID=281362 RepID=UPI001CFA0EE1|nr:peptidylprolyl isomerase [Dechloromonas denitrificans]UCV07562.1 peptidyl-prolyl cis-trans isomerase [Dechloromonas denitrificans]